ncbi:hypothetical protein NW762_010249 [Fusarium torreyae]|uniref:Heterokaryon incompatibility domain-containing protein n=1 Tax=Fusarium torreyae TaxID=1237075 RepID=A0A9W8RV90_9HYPO|nr:hypothetical protein NW762_010249 [Fusarium torreyae]
MASLCDYCDKVPLSLKEIMASPSNRYSLGSWPRIFVSRCPLCRLVKRAYCEEYRANPMMNGLPSKNTTLTWFVNGPVNGGAYSIEGVADYWICFAAKSHPSITLALSSNERSNYLCSIVDAELEISRISRWLSICMTTHGEECSSSSATFDLAFPGLQVLRLLDVQRDCLVEVRDLHPYLALSYIWGAVPNFRLTKANLERLLVPGAMRDVFRLPRTIRDAITLAKKLHIQYLWVDALCLIQNDSDDLEQGVNVMDLIYERSLLTIIAACGTDANAGLPGVQTGSRQASRPTLEIEPGIRLGLYSGLDQLLKPSAYYSRGWTYVIFPQISCRK